MSFKFSKLRKGTQGHVTFNTLPLLYLHVFSKVNNYSKFKCESFASFYVSDSSAKLNPQGQQLSDYKSLSFLSPKNRQGKKMFWCLLQDKFSY